MKDSKEYSKRIQKLYRALKRDKPGPEKPRYDEPVDALVYGLVSENLTESKARDTMKKLFGYFVDSNDLRVALTEEILDVLGDENPTTKKIASAVKRMLTAVFEKYNAVTLQSLKKLGKRPAKQILQKIDGATAFAIDYCMLTALAAHAIPLTERMIQFLNTERLVHPQADRQEIEGFLTRQISAKNAFEFYYLLRRRSESTAPHKKKRSPRKVKTPAKKKAPPGTKKRTGGKLKK